MRYIPLLQASSVGKSRLNTTTHEVGLITSLVFTVSALVESPKEGWKVNYIIVHLIILRERLRNPL